MNRFLAVLVLVGCVVTTSYSLPRHNVHRLQRIYDKVNDADDRGTIDYDAGDRRTIDYDTFADAFKEYKQTKYHEMLEDFGRGYRDYFKEQLIRDPLARRHFLRSHNRRDPLRRHPHISRRGYDSLKRFYNQVRDKQLKDIHFGAHNTGTEWTPENNTAVYKKRDEMKDIHFNPDYEGEEWTGNENENAEKNSKKETIVEGTKDFSNFKRHFSTGRSPRRHLLRSHERRDPLRHHPHISKRRYDSLKRFYNQMRGKQLKDIHFGAHTGTEWKPENDTAVYKDSSKRHEMKDIHFGSHYEVPKWTESENTENENTKDETRRNDGRRKSDDNSVDDDEFNWENLKDVIYGEQLDEDERKGDYDDVNDYFDHDDFYSDRD